MYAIILQFYPYGSYIYWYIPLCELHKKIFRDHREQRL